MLFMSNQCFKIITLSLKTCFMKFYNMQKSYEFRQATKWYAPPVTRLSTGKTPKAKPDGFSSYVTKTENQNNDSFSIKLMKLESKEESKTPAQTQSTPKVKGKAKGGKKKKIRHDVKYKTILRECRRFYQTKLSDKTGFITSKKVRQLWVI